MNLNQSFWLKNIISLILWNVKVNYIIINEISNIKIKKYLGNLRMKGK